MQTGTSILLFAAPTSVWAGALELFGGLGGESNLQVVKLMYKTLERVRIWCRARFLTIVEVIMY